MSGLYPEIKEAFRCIDEGRDLDVVTLLEFAECPDMGILALALADLAIPEVLIQVVSHEAIYDWGLRSSTA